MRICSENTAINSGVAKSVKDFTNLDFIKKDGQVLDYGAGKLRNAKYLLDKGFSVSILETEEQIRRLKARYGEDIFKPYEGVFSPQRLPSSKYSLIICAFVLCVLQGKIDRLNMVQNIYNLLEEDGVAIIETRTEKCILNAKFIEPYKDGYLIGKNKVKTFQKPYTEDELKNLFVENGFEIIQSKVYSSSIILIVKKG
jgi:hypothetical protein